MDGEGGKKGFDRHQMWGLYAEQGSGVCLVFDKDILSKRLDESIIHAPVIYEDIVKTFYKSQSTNLNVVCDSIKENYQEIFFSKRMEWEHENEYRMMKRCPDDNREEYLNFGAALKYIIISNIYMESDIVKYNNNITELKKHTNVPILVYGNGLDDYSINPSNFGMNTPVAAFFKTIGGMAFDFMLLILSGYIAMSIGDRPRISSWVCWWSYC